MRTLSWQQVYARRLAASRLDARAPHEELLDVARTTLGVHAQLMTGAELALSARVEGVTRDEVRELLWERRSLVKGNTIRGTLHLHPAEDYALWQSFRGNRWREPKWLEWQELTLADAEYLREAVLAVLDEPRTREEIGAAVGRVFGERIATDSWGHLLAPSSDERCQGPPRGRNVTFVRCDRWLPAWGKRDPDDALREIVRRYVETYGPVRRDELEHWFALKLPGDALDGLEEVEIEGVRSFVLPGTEFLDAEPSGVRLLAHYDVYVIACHPRDHLIPEQKERIFLRGAGPSPALLVDGRVAGVWSRTLRGRRMEIEVEPFGRLMSGQRRELEDEAARVARTYGAEATLLEK
ncbi:MAG: winged helix DNA-binding domain-containing protein [Actinomycetota bacterium]